MLSEQSNYFWLATCEKPVGEDEPDMRVLVLEELFQALRGVRIYI